MLGEIALPPVPPLVDGERGLDGVVVVGFVGTPPRTVVGVGKGRVVTMGVLGVPLPVVEVAVPMVVESPATGVSVPVAGLALPSTLPVAAGVPGLALAPGAALELEGTSPGIDSVRVLDVGMASFREREAARLCAHNKSPRLMTAVAVKGTPRK